MSAPALRDAPGAEENLEPREAGSRAFRAGEPIEACPHAERFPFMRRAWCDGWREAFHLSRSPDAAADRHRAELERESFRAWQEGRRFEAGGKGGAR